jgi:hypothetical protein
MFLDELINFRNVCAVVLMKQLLFPPHIFASLQAVETSNKTSREVNILANIEIILTNP